MGQRILWNLCYCERNNWNVLRCVNATVGFRQLLIIKSAPKRYRLLIHFRQSISHYRDRKFSLLLWPWFYTWKEKIRIIVKQTLKKEGLCFFNKKWEKDLTDTSDIFLSVFRKVEENDRKKKWIILKALKTAWVFSLSIIYNILLFNEFFTDNTTR